MSGLVDLDRIASRADRALSRLDREQTREVERYLSTALRRTLDQTQPLYARAMADVDGAASNAAFRLARGRVLADELEGTIRGLVGQPDGALEGLLGRVATARAEARPFVEDTLRIFGDAVTISTPVNHRALSGVVERAATRLYNHADGVVDRIKEDVVTGLVRGDSWTQVTRAIREDTGYLRSRAEMIAITELHSAQADARQELYTDLGVELVIRYVTIDDRTCEYCAPRQGEVTKMVETVEVLHPRCRCLLAPFDPEWLLDDTLVPDELAQMREDNLRQLEELGKRPKDGPAPFERVRDRVNFRQGPIGRGRPAPVWRPGLPTDALVSWIGRSFTNLGAFATPAAGGATVAAVAPAQTAAVDPLVLARELPKKAREQLVALEDEVRGLASNVARLEQERDVLRAAYRENGERLAEANERIRTLDYQLSRLRAASGSAEEIAELERQLRETWTLQRAIRAQSDELYEGWKKALLAVADAERDAAAFSRTRGHAILANTATGHQNGAVPLAHTLRDADLRSRVERAQTWLAEHTTLRASRPIPVVRLKKNARAYAREDTIHLAPHNGTGVAIHEAAHALDHQHPSMVARAIAWRDERTVGESYQRLSVLLNDSGYKPSEVAKPDKFFHPYIGKSYGTRATEVLSMGLQRMYEDPVGFATADPGHFDLIFRIMKGLPDP